MAVKRTRKKSTGKKNEYDVEEIQNIENVDGEKTNLESKDDKPKENKEYVTYDAEMEFKLKEVFSEENKILIGPVRLTRFEKARITGARSLQLSLGAPTLQQNSKRTNRYNPDSQI